MRPPARGPGRSTLYTRTGDDGTTGLLGPGRTFKDDPRVEAYGCVDELNACLGWARSLCQAEPVLARELDPVLGRLQQMLFVVGAELASPSGGDEEDVRLPRVRGEDVEQLERLIDTIDATLPPLGQFVLPGGCPAAACLHLARTVARRAERRVVSLARSSRVRPQLLAFLNRLSDLLFVLARQANFLTGNPEHPWQPPSPPKPAAG